jgi:endo-1,4-beta-xylanase
MYKKIISLIIILALLAGCDGQLTTDNEQLTIDIKETPPLADSSDEGSAVSEATQLDIPKVEFELIYASDFSESHSGFTGRSGETLILEDDALITTNRTANWNGPKLELGASLLPNTLYEFSAVMRSSSEAAQEITASLEIKMASTHYENAARVRVPAGEWFELSGSFTTPQAFEAFALYFEGGEALEDGSFPDIILAEVTVRRVIKEVLPPDALPSLWEAHADYFKTGVGVVLADIRNPETSALIVRHFNSMTMGNEMKPSMLLDHAASAADPNLMPVIRTAVLDECLAFARDNNIAMRGHTLVWHEQTPKWFFKVDYSREDDAEFVSREVMLERLEHYIETVLRYCGENFPGVIYAWDVVNEAIDPGSADANKVRDSHAGEPNPWYVTVGADYIEQAFVFARKYAEPDVLLFYNDFNTFHSNKIFPILALLADLQEKGLVDGMGMQAHLGFTDPSVVDFQAALLRYAELGLEIHLTELDINLDNNSPEALERLAVRYKRLINMVRFCIENELANIGNVTVWGLSDRDTWLSFRDGGGRKYPLLFDEYLYPKLAFYGFLLCDSVADF